VRGADEPGAGQRRAHPLPGWSFADLLAEPGVEVRCRLGGPVGLLAVHGGIEGGTAEVAEAVADATGASLYAVVQPDHLRWHLPSTLVDPAGCSRLRSFLAHVRVAVSIHGYGRRERPHDVLLGGAARDVAAELADALRPHVPGYVVVNDLDRLPPTMRGLHPANPVNLPVDGGVQVELPPDIRGTTWRWTDTGPASPDPSLIEGLSAAVRRLERRYSSTSKVPPARQ
jgi:phage replication-related protein YjqB (UPF0714/DUF867 family)